MALIVKGDDEWIVDTVAGRRVLTVTPDVDDNTSIYASVTGTREWTFRANLESTLATMARPGYPSDPNS